MWMSREGSDGQSRGGVMVSGGVVVSAGVVVNEGVMVMISKEGDSLC